MAARSAAVWDVTHALSKSLSGYITTLQIAHRGLAHRGIGGGCGRAMMHDQCSSVHWRAGFIHPSRLVLRRLLATATATCYSSETLLSITDHAMPCPCRSEPSPDASYTHPGAPACYSCASVGNVYVHATIHTHLPILYLCLTCKTPRTSMSEVAREIFYFTGTYPHHTAHHTPTYFTYLPHCVQK